MWSGNGQETVYGIYVENKENKGVVNLFFSQRHLLSGLNDVKCFYFFRLICQIMYAITTIRTDFRFEINLKKMK